MEVRLKMAMTMRMQLQMTTRVPLVPTEKFTAVILILDVASGEKIQYSLYSLCYSLFLWFSVPVGLELALSGHLAMWAKMKQMKMVTQTQTKEQSTIHGRT
eukprot:1439737-Ditylum_brightwellii.AAC.1